MVARFVPRIGRAAVRSSVSTPTANATFAARRAMQDVIKEYTRWVQHVEDVTPEILVEALEPAFKLSQIYCPQDTGKLKKSGYLESTTFRGIPTVEIGYGKGGDPDYAAVVHENMEYRHKAPTKAKFLQAALEEQDGDIKERILSRLKHAAGV